MDITYQQVEKQVTEEIGNNPVYMDVLRRADTLELTAVVELVDHIESMVAQLTNAEPAAVKSIAQKLYDQNYGLSAITTLRADHSISEIWCNSPSDIWIERAGKRSQCNNLSFRDEADMRRVMDLLCRFDKQELSVTNPIVECRLADGSRLTAIVPPVAEAPSFSLRLPNAFVPTTKAMLDSGTINKDMVQFLKILVRGRANIVVIGETGAGKTQFIRWLVGLMRQDLRVVSIETSKELYLQKLYRNQNIMEVEECSAHGVGLDKLFYTALHMSPDIIIYSEMRSYEAEWVINAMRRGHPGSMSTLHTSSPELLPGDVAEMICEDGKSRDVNLLMQRVANAVDIVIQIHRFEKTGKRRVIRISEIAKDGGQSYRIMDLYAYKESGDTFNQVGQVHTKALQMRLLQYATGGDDPIPQEQIEELLYMF